MFVRWKRRKKAISKPWRRLRRSKFGDSLYGVLVETNRVNGSPRQKVVCYLGSLDEGHRESVWTRVDFWDRATAKLDQLQLSRRERAKIEESISRVVSRVPDEEAATFRRERKEFFDELDRLLRLKKMISIWKKMFEGK